MKYKLNESNIDAVCKEADAFLIRSRTEPKDRTHTRLSIEEVLLDYMDAFGSDVEFSVDYSGGIFKSRVRLSVPGEPADPFSIRAADPEDEQLLANVLSRMGQRPKWQYARGVNTITYTPAKKSAPDGVKLLIAIIAAIVLGLVVRALPDNVSTLLQRDVVSPLLDTFLGFLNAVAGPMIFLSVVWGIYSIGDISTFSEIGRRLCVRFILYLCVMTALIALFSLPFFSLHYGNAQSGNPYSELYHTHP